MVRSTFCICGIGLLLLFQTITLSGGIKFRAHRIDPDLEFHDCGHLTCYGEKNVTDFNVDNFTDVYLFDITSTYNKKFLQHLNAAQAGEGLVFIEEEGYRVFGRVTSDIVEISLTLTNAADCQQRTFLCSVWYRRDGSFVNTQAMDLPDSAVQYYVREQEIRDMKAKLEAFKESGPLQELHEIVDLYKELSEEVARLEDHSMDVDPLECRATSDDGTRFAKLDGRRFSKCDPDGWILVQNNADPEGTSFNQTWEAYKHGFGNINGNFYIGNELMHKLTSENTYKLKIILGPETEFDPIILPPFTVDAEENDYTLHCDNPMLEAKPFSTFDRDNDGNSDANCASDQLSGWWFAGCGNVNLNGRDVYGHVIWPEGEPSSVQVFIKRHIITK